MKWVLHRYNLSIGKRIESLISVIRISLNFGRVYMVDPEAKEG